ncbi:TIGR00341 family protein [Desulfovibrio sulfodismutans]|uniref:TIGR00341 family protein n=1 Tax=Desulfolutivibrio sulfodismutans TaxID=63561 RepID=A0A7K3NNY8_9BACT|nr:TIGR00341 family protein [Desulfolutivibrio sulfodismutans]NDY57912.1 TIGR00341 family protein [Desulfolutivibrio sulfodismutans]
MDNDHKATVRETICKNSELSVAFMAMNMLAATIASYGLFANSPAVIIGAMIIAMLLGPITGVSLSLVDSDTKLLVTSITTLVAGAVGVIVTALIIGTIHIDVPISEEILSRTHPNFADLMIALAGGAAGAYAYVSPRLSVAFVGVAIATALVPPLCAASILLARGHYDLSFGAFLLTFTNIVAIQFSSSVVLWLTGFRNISHAKGVSFYIFFKNNSVSIVILAILGVVLTDTMHETLSEKIYEANINQVLKMECDHAEGCFLPAVRFDENDKGVVIINAVVRGPNPPRPERIAAIEQKLPAHPKGKPTELRARFVPTATINRNGVLYED